MSKFTKYKILSSKELAEITKRFFNSDDELGFDDDSLVDPNNYESELRPNKDEKSMNDESTYDVVPLTNDITPPTNDVVPPTNDDGLFMNTYKVELYSEQENRISDNVVVSRSML